MGDAEPGLGVAEVLRAKGSLNWDYILRKAFVARKGRILFLGLVLAADLLQAPAPLEVLVEARRYPVVRELTREVTVRLFSEEPR